MIRAGLILVLLLAPRPFMATVDRADPDHTIVVHASDRWVHVRVSSADAASLPVRWTPDTAGLVNHLATGRLVLVRPSWVDPAGRMIGTITLPDGRDLGREIIKRRSQVHYRNGREAKQGDRVIFLDPYSGKPEAGMLYGLSTQSDACNGRLAKEASSDPYVNIKDCVHVDDVNAAFPKIK